MINAEHKELAPQLQTTTMKIKHVELTENNGGKVSINPEAVSAIQESNIPNGGGTSKMATAIIVYSYFIYVQEDYETVKKLIWGGGDER